MASGYGLYATKFPATVAVGLASKGFIATPHFSGVTSVGAGGTLGGTIDFTNQTGGAKQVLLKLTANGTTASISPSTPITVPSQASGNPPSVPFTVTIGKQAGLASLELQVVDATTGQVYNTVADEIQVTTPPPWYKQVPRPDHRRDHRARADHRRPARAPRAPPVAPGASTT